MTFLSALLTGLALGGVYGLIAIGFHVTSSVCGAVNFAQGSSAMLGAVATLMLADAGLPFPVAIAAALPLCAGYGLVVERVAVRPFLRNGSDGWLMATVALGLVCDNGMLALFGTEPRAMPSVLTGQTVRLAGHDLAVYPLHLLIPPVALLVATALDLYRRRTLHGIAMLAVAQNRDAASLMGIGVGRVVAGAFAVSSVLAGIAGMLVAPLGTVEPGMGIALGLKAFAVAILGGLDRAWGIVAAGFLFGTVEAMATTLIGSGYTQILTFSLVIAALAVRPDGLLGRTRISKV